MITLAELLASLDLPSLPSVAVAPKKRVKPVPDATAEPVEKRRSSRIQNLPAPSVAAAAAAAALAAADGHPDLPRHQGDIRLAFENTAPEVQCLSFSHLLLAAITLKVCGAHVVPRVVTGICGTDYQSSELARFGYGAL